LTHKVLKISELDRLKSTVTIWRCGL